MMDNATRIILKNMKDFHEYLSDQIRNLTILIEKMDNNLREMEKLYGCQK
jgi:hypothetical protein